MTRGQTTDAGYVRRARRDLEAVLSAAAVPVVVSDLSGVLSFANPAAEVVFSLDRGVAVGRRFDELLDDDLAAAVAKLAAGGFGSVVRRLEIASVPYEARSSVAFDRNDRRIGVVTVLHDISQLLASDQIKDELLATVNHELRTPLTSLRGFAELLLHGDVPPGDQQRFLRIILDEAERLTTLIEDFLDLQRLDARDAPRGQENVTDVAATLRDVAAGFVQAGDRPPRIVMDVDEGLPPVVIDSADLAKALHHVLENAHKYSPDGGDVLVRAAHEGNAVVIQVTDHGIGIPPMYLESIFGRFFRVDNSETRRIGGSGLGLAIVKRVVQRAGGSVRAESIPEEQTMLTITLPARDPNQKRGDRS